MKMNAKIIIVVLESVTLGAFALAPLVQAVVPAPDGGYPGFNTAEGQNALLSLDTNTGLGNTAVGWFSLKSNVGASFNTGIGTGTLVLNTADQNTAVGAAALLLNTAGESNTAVGVTALLNNTTGSGNSAFGWGALAANTADANTAVGLNALLNNTTGGTLGNILAYDLGPNVAVGAGALRDNTIASANTAVGFQALRNFTTGPVGFEQLGACTAVGFQALANDTGGAANSCFGYQALFSNSGGTRNTAIGLRALYNNTTGFANVAVGEGALSNNTQGIGNIALGLEAGSGVTTADHVICIGVAGHDVDGSCYIGNIYGQPVQLGDVPVMVDSNQKLGTTTSSRRFKRDIKPIAKASEAILALNPVTFHYANDVENTPRFGLVAEDVADVDPALVVRDKDGEIYSVRYEAVNAMLLNEFLKEHTKVEQQSERLEDQTFQIQKQQRAITELKSLVAQQQRGMELLNAQLQQQANQIQKVSARVQLKKLPPRTVVNDQ
jgi:hypothetical protein